MSIIVSRLFYMRVVLYSFDLQVLELRRQIEKQSTDLGATHRSLSDLRSKNAELEERLIQINKELHQAQQLAKSLEIELNENVAQKGDQEERIATLEKRYVRLLVIIVSRHEYKFQGSSKIHFYGIKSIQEFGFLVFI